MITTSSRRTGATACLALAIAAAGLMYAVMPARADSAPIYASRAAYESSQTPAQAYPNPEYPNHKPRRGNYPGSYPTTAAPAQAAGSDFDWRAAAAGAAGMLGLILLLAAARATARMTRDRRRRIPFVVDVRDETPTTS